MLDDPPKPLPESKLATVQVIRTFVGGESMHSSVQGELRAGNSIGDSPYYDPNESGVTYIRIEIWQRHHQ